MWHRKCAGAVGPLAGVVCGLGAAMAAPDARFTTSGEPGMSFSNVSGTSWGVDGATGCAGPTVTQSTAPALIEGGNSVWCGSLQTSEQTAIARQFEGLPPSTSVRCVEFGVDVNTGGPWPVEVWVWSGTIDGVDSLSLLLATSINIPAGTNDALFSVDFGPVPVPDGVPVVVELRTPSRLIADGGDGALLVLGFNNNGQSDPTYVKAATCGAPEFVPTATIGFPQSHAVMTVGILPGIPGQSCCHPSGIGFADPECAKIVCAIDPFCCETFCDVQCEALALELCDCGPTEPAFPSPCDFPVETISLRSGQAGGGPGAPGQPDDVITCFHGGGQTGCFASSLDSGSGLPFGAASIGAAAEVIAAFPVWQPVLDCDPHARWINWNADPVPGGGSIPANWGNPPQSTLYAHDFTVSSATVGAAFITICWSVDDVLGDPSGGPAPIGAYLFNTTNGVTPLPLYSGGNFGADTGPIVMALPSGAVAPGQNTLFMYQREAGCSTSGLIYSAQVDICSCPDNDQCPVGAISELEVCGQDVNGGCNHPANAAQPIACGDTICATFHWDTVQAGVRDTDWYEFTLVAPACITWEVWADVPVDVGILGALCPPVVFAQGSGDCPAVATTCPCLPPGMALPPGTYRVFAAPSFSNAPIACFSAASNYLARLTCTPCDPPIPGRMCCNENGPGFMDAECEELVCAIDPFCCFEFCDAGCEALAAELCECCRGCAIPPRDLLSWWTFDEPAGSSSFADSGQGHTATSVGGATTGGGHVGNALGVLDGISQHAVTPGGVYNFGGDAFSVDAWICWDGSHGGTIISSTPGLNFQVWGLFVDTLGELKLVLGDACLRSCIGTGPGAIPPNVWTHVAMTATACECLTCQPPFQHDVCCCSFPSRVFTLYVNAAPVFTYPTGGDFCNITSSGPLVIGGDAGFGCVQAFPGKIDEVQVFHHGAGPGGDFGEPPLSQEEIATIYEAGSKGKCKHRCHIPWDRAFPALPFPGSNQITVPLTICNDSPNPGMFQVSLSPSSPFGGCNGPAVTGFTVVGPNPVTIPPNTCQVVFVQIARPAGLEPGEVSCYRACVTNIETGVHVYCHGSVVRESVIIAEPAEPICCIAAGFEQPGGGGGGDPMGPPDVGNPGIAVMLIQNPTGAPVSLPYSVRAVPSEMGPGIAPVSLNGLPPGERVIGTLLVPPGQVVELETEVTFLAAAPFRFFDLVLAVNEPGGGDGLVDVLSMGLASGPIPPPPAPCPPDLNGDGFVDSLDLNLVLASFGCTSGGCGGDTDGDGDTDSVDLNVVLADFGQNCP